jgi:acyl-CoA synthetase (AMP-forming)/AMP-acid ligase II
VSSAAGPAASPARSSGPGQANAVDGDAVVDHLRAELSSYKLPRQVAVVDVVPRAANGKADYPSARRLFTDASP